MSNDYRIAWGQQISKTALNANNAYLWQAYPLQADQFSLYTYPWSLPKDDCTTFPAYQRYTLMADQVTYRGDGFIQFQWCFQYLTEGMVAYVDSLGWSFYPFSGCTVQTRLEDGTFQAYWVTAVKPRPDQELKRGYYGVEDYTIRFYGGVVAPP